MPPAAEQGQRLQAEGEPCLGVPPEVAPGDVVMVATGLLAAATSAAAMVPVPDPPLPPAARRVAGTRRPKSPPRPPVAEDDPLRQVVLSHLVLQQTALRRGLPLKEAAAWLLRGLWQDGVLVREEDWQRYYWLPGVGTFRLRSAARGRPPRGAGVLESVSGDPQAAPGTDVRVRAATANVRAWSRLPSPSLQADYPPMVATG